MPVQVDRSFDQERHRDRDSKESGMHKISYKRANDAYVTTKYSWIVEQDSNKGGEK